MIRTTRLCIRTGIDDGKLIIFGFNRITILYPNVAKNKLGNISKGFEPLEGENVTVYARSKYENVTQESV